MEIVLRPWKIEDLETLITMGNNKNIAKYMADAFPNPYTEEKGRAFIEASNSNLTARIFAITLDGKPVGSIGLHFQADILKKNVEIGYWLGEEHWGKGIMPHAIKQMVEYGFANLDIVRIFARIYGINIPSQKAVQKSNFKLEAKFEKTIYKNNEFLDELIYAIRKP